MKKFTKKFSHWWGNLSLGQRAWIVTIGGFVTLPLWLPVLLVSCMVYSGNDTEENDK